MFDLNPLIAYLLQLTSSQMSLRKALKSLPGANWAFKVDASKMFWHILVAERWRAYLRFMHKDEVYEFVSMPLGLSITPWICNELLSRLHMHLWSKRVNCIF